MGLKVFSQLTKTVTKKLPYIAPEIRTLDSRAVKSLGLKMEQLTGDVIQIARNNYLKNIEKIGLNERDARSLKEILFVDAKLQEEFNAIINKDGLNLNDLRELLSGKEVKNIIGTGFRYVSPLNCEYMTAILGRLKTMQPNELKVIKNLSIEDLECIYLKNATGEFLLPDKYLSKISKLSGEPNVYFGRVRNSDLQKIFIEYNIGDKTCLSYDIEEKVLKIFEETGTKKLEILRDVDGNEIKFLTDTAVSNNVKAVIEETLYLKDASGSPSEMIRYEQSGIEGVFNVIKTDLKAGKKFKISEGVVDKTGRKTVTQNLTSPSGINTKVNYEELPNGNSSYQYLITDKNGKALLDNTRTRTVVNESEFAYSFNNKNYGVKFTGTDKIEIFDIETKQLLGEINLNTLLSGLTNDEKNKFILMLKQIPADELLGINRYSLEQLFMGSIESSSMYWGSNSIATIPNQFVFLHELGHQKDLRRQNLSKDIMMILRDEHRQISKGEDSFDVICNNYKKCLTDKNFDKLYNSRYENVEFTTQISSRQELLDIYNKEKAAYIKKFGEDDHRIDYFINCPGLVFGPQSETLAEINAILSTPKSCSSLGTRSYLLAENFPETITCAGNYLHTV